MNLILTVIMATLLSCSDNVENTGNSSPEESVAESRYSRTSLISNVMNDPVFGDYGRLIFPVQTSYWSGNTLEQLRLTYYNYIDPDMTVEIVNYMKSHAEAGETIFYDIYTEAEKRADATKRNTGLFFFKGNAGAPFAICNAGGAFAYVGAMHDSFPHALELSKRGYNAFALIYRPDDAYEDLARAIEFIHDNAARLGVSATQYSLWGGSAGARMAATLGNSSYLQQLTGRSDIPQASAVVMQYTGYSDANRYDAPTYVSVGTSDGIASWRTMQNRLNRLESLGIPTEFHAYSGLPHGFGLGTGTVAEGWINDAVKFWERQMGTSGISNAPMSGTVNLWERGNIPTVTHNVNNSDGPDFIPNMEVFTVADNATPKGAVIICPGGAFQFRSMQNEGYDVANMLVPMGYQCFIVNYRIAPYTMRESATDLQRAIRYVRAHAEDYRINPENIALVGFSAGGILNGEVLLNWRDLTNGTALDKSYHPDALDNVPVSACAVGMIYSFYGRLSVSMNNVETLRAANLPPAFYCWGTRDGFAGQFTQNSNAVREAGCEVETHILQGYPHGYGAASNPSVWGNDFDAFLTRIMSKNTSAINGIKGGNTQNDAPKYYDVNGRQLESLDNAHGIFVVKDSKGTKKIIK